MNDNNNDKALEITNSDELHKLTEQYLQLRIIGNQTIIGRGKILEGVAQKRLWMSQGYDSNDQCVADPNGFDTRPRTARLLRLLYRVWFKKLAKLGVTEEQVIRIDTMKLAYMARAIMRETNPDKILELLHRAKTLTLRELQDDSESENFIIMRGTATARKDLQENDKHLVTLLVKFKPDVSVGTFMATFGEKEFETKFWYPRNSEVDND